MVVVVPLFVFVVVLTVMVLAGKLFFSRPEPYVVQTPPSLAVAASSGVVYSDGHAVRRIEAGDTIWIVRAGNGLPVVFTDSTGAEALGVADARLRPIDRP